MLEHISLFRRRFDINERFGTSESGTYRFLSDCYQYSIIAQDKKKPASAGLNTMQEHGGDECRVYASRVDLPMSNIRKSGYSHSIFLVSKQSSDCRIA